MFSRLKNLFGKFGGKETVSTLGETAASVPVAATTPALATRPTAPSSNRSPQPLVTATATGVGGSDAVSIPWDSILVRLPEPLKTHVNNPGRATGTISVPVRRINEQLRTGAVRIAFGELRQAAPTGMFASSSMADMTLIDLPMKEILSRLQPTSWTRRSNQKRMEVPEDVPPIFGPESHISPKIGSRKNSSLHPDPVTPGTQPAPIYSSASPTSAGHTTRFTKSAPAAPVKLADASIPAARSSSPATSGHTTRFFKSASPATTQAGQPSTSSGHATRFFQADPLSPARNSAERKPTLTGEALEIQLQLLIGDWPEPVGQEIAQDGLTQTQVHLPFSEIENGLKRGKILITWKQIRSWIAAPLPLGPSPLDDIPLELPLNAVVPLFLARRSSAKERKSVAVSENIPDIFSGGPTASSAAAERTGTAAGASLSAVAPNQDAASMTNAASENRHPGVPELSQIFDLPDKRNWTPVEIAQRTSALPGVAGAVIALHDGLLVAGELPNGMSPETVAAFLAPMFAKITQYSKEMSLGELSQLSLVAGQLPLHIFKSGKIYFGVLGRAGQSLPLAKLSAIATEFGRNLK